MWTLIQSDQDAIHLLDVFGGFHDGCIREMHVWTETWVSDDLGMACPTHRDVRIRVLFQRQFRNPSAIEMVFDQVVGMHLVPSPENYCSIIFDACLSRWDDTFYWAGRKGWTPDSADRDSVTWIGAKVVHWRDASDWMGEEPRYAAQAPPPPEYRDNGIVIPGAALRGEA